MSVNRVDKTFARHEKRLRKLEQKSRRANWINGALIIAVPAITSVCVGLIPVLLPPAEANPTFVCTESYHRAIDMYESDGVWMALPEESEEEAFCAVNDRMIELLELSEDETVYVKPTP